MPEQASMRLFSMVVRSGEFYAGELVLIVDQRRLFHDSLPRRKNSANKPHSVNGR